MIRIAAPLNTEQGYGNMSVAFIRAMIAHGRKVELVPLHSQSVPSDLRKYLARDNRLQDIDVTFCPPQMFTHKTTILFTMWETDKVPTSAGLESAKIVVIPSESSINAFRAVLRSEQRIEKCELGADGNYSIPNSNGFNLLTISADHGVPQRKQAQAIVDAFVKAFPHQRDVTLTVKQNADCAPLHCFDSRVTIIKKSLPADELLSLIQQSTVGVQASCAEGWGLPHNEFIANGRPVISPICSGQADFLTDECCYAVRSRIGTYTNNNAGFSGKARFVDADDLAKKMLYAYENPLSVTKKSIAAYERAQLFTRTTMTRRWLQIVDKYL